jgi:LmbE family N-acetylglucosaminyl deacetylase
MYRAVTRGAQVTVVWITSGDGSIIDLALASRWPLSADNYRQLGAERMREARSAAAVLGVPAANQTFLRFPDAALSSVVRSDARRPARSPYTKVAHVPYPDAWQPNAPYSAEALTQMLASLLDRANPTLLLAPCASDMHPDHAATAHLLQSALRERPQIHLACWMVHARSGWPTPRGLAPERALAPPATSEPLDWTSNVLSTAEREAKLKSIERYRTQRRSMESFLFSFVRTNELFASVAGP